MECVNSEIVAIFFLLHHLNVSYGPCQAGAHLLRLGYATVRVTVESTTPWEQQHSDQTHGKCVFLKVVSERGQGKVSGSGSQIRCSQTHTAVGDHAASLLAAV